MQSMTSGCRSLALMCCRQAYTAEPTGSGEPDGPLMDAEQGKTAASVQIDREKKDSLGTKLCTAH